jgi:hypothetical protein
MFSIIVKKIKKKLPIKKQERVMLLQKASAVLNLIKKVAESFYLSVFTLLFGVLFWALNLTNVVVFGLLSVFILVLIFAKDLKNLFTPVFYISLFIPEIHVMNDYTAYYIAVGVALLTLIISIAYRTIKKKKDIKIGRFTVGIIASYFAYLLGGLFYKFTLEVTQSATNIANNTRDKIHVGDVSIYEYV